MIVGANVSQFFLGFAQVFVRLHVEQHAYAFAFCIQFSFQQRAGGEQCRRNERDDEVEVHVRRDAEQRDLRERGRRRCRQRLFSSQVPLRD